MCGVTVIEILLGEITLSSLSSSSHVYQSHLSQSLVDFPRASKACTHSNLLLSPPWLMMVEKTNQQIANDYDDDRTWRLKEKKKSKQNWSHFQRFSSPLSVFDHPKRPIPGSFMFSLRETRKDKKNSPSNDPVDFEDVLRHTNVGEKFTGAFCFFFYFH